MSEETSVSDTRAGQEGPTPDFIPGWFESRPGNPDPATREAVRFIGTQDFPINFLRSTEMVFPAPPPQLGVCVGERDSAIGMCLAVPPGYWMVRDADGRPQLYSDEDFKVAYGRSDRDWIAPVEREVPSGRPAAAERHRHGAEAESLTRAGRRIDTATEIRREIASVPPEAWKGTPPAEGTRRALILDAIREHDGDSDEGQLELADAIEEALLRVVDQGATPESGSPASVAMDLLDTFEIPRTREGAILTIADRVTALADLLVEARRERDVKQATIEGLAATVTAKADALERRVDGLTKLTSRAEGKAPPGTRELVIVLEDVSDPDGPPEYRFIELENQDGRSIGSFPIRSSEQPPLKEIAIPYGRDNAWVSEVAYQAAGAATRPLMEDHPDYVFPSERVSDAVAELLSDFGIPRACRDCAEEELGHGAKEVDARRDATIKQLEADVERFLGEREEARSGESRFAEERDCAFALLRWLLPVTVAKRLDS